MSTNKALIAVTICVAAAMLWLLRPAPVSAETAFLSAAGEEGTLPGMALHPEGGVIRKLIRARMQSLRTLRANLDVTEEQRERIRAIRTKHRDELLPLFEEVVKARRALRKAATAESANEEDIRAAADALGKAMGDLAVRGSSVFAEAKDVLTTEQLEVLRAHRAERELQVDRALDEVRSK